MLSTRAFFFELEARLESELARYIYKVFRPDLTEVLTRLVEVISVMYRSGYWPVVTDHEKEQELFAFPHRFIVVQFEPAIGRLNVDVSGLQSIFWPQRDEPYPGITKFHAMTLSSEQRAALGKSLNTVHPYKRVVDVT